MDIDTPPPYTSREAQAATFAELSTKIASSTGNPDVVNDTLEAFRAFLASQENVRISKNQLQVLKGQGVFVLEEASNYLKAGGNASNIFSEAANIFVTVSNQLQSKTKWEEVLQDQEGPQQLNIIIDNAYRDLENLQIKISHERATLGSTRTGNELSIARQKDDENLAELRAVIAQTSQAADSLTTRVQQSIDRNLKIIGDPTVAQPHQDAKRALAIVAELTGQSLPSSTLLGKEFVAIGPHAIHQGASYDIYQGQYFTGENIAIKKLRHSVDEATMRKTHERFARQALNWSFLRHDAILPFYGMGVEPSPTVEGEFQMYLASPYLQNRDAKTYLNKYNQAPLNSRLLMCMDVARGLEYLHGNVDLPEGHGVVHSALDIYNVLIKDSGRAVISGFSHMKKIMTENFQESFTGDNSNYRYMGPELMQDEPQITYGTDVYSWAMTSLEILTDVPPFGTKTRGPKIIQLVAAGRKPERGDHPKIEQYPHSNELWELFEKCWSPTPQERPPADILVQRLKPMLQQFGGKSKPVVQNPPPSGKGPTPTEYGPASQNIVQSSPPQPPPPPPPHPAD
ncbi:hypothetical protein FRC09_005501 [Ceratobasidium sp. 395]|nr:hypothetical protein FRC09_005501 [Ceratobasidium sp. 395]